MDKSIYANFGDILSSNTIGAKLTMQMNAVMLYAMAVATPVVLEIEEAKSPAVRNVTVLKSKIRIHMNTFL